SMKPKIFNEKMQQEIEELKKLAMHSKVVAIGECGLDYYSHNQQETINSQQRMLQKAGFIAQLELAVKLKVPVIIHTRPSLGTMDAYEDMWTILQQYSSDSSHLAPPMILHCYQGDTEMTKKFLGLSSVYFSFTGNITYPTKKMFVGTKNDLTETVKMVPLTRLFVETDCPFLAPQEKRGERNEPAYVTIVAEHICALHKVKMIDLEDNLEKNFVRVFARPTL
ncbi:MAG TPA: TatD family hydrolase, partial [Patescibacteria group bacterium]|nr:TatD family hydrolase [Patescibacteria group bacterium]